MLLCSVVICKVGKLHGRTCRWTRVWGGAIIFLVKKHGTYTETAVRMEFVFKKYIKQWYLARKLLCCLIMYVNLCISNCNYNGFCLGVTPRFNYVCSVLWVINV